MSVHVEIFTEGCFDLDGKSKNRRLENFDAKKIHNLVRMLNEYEPRAMATATIIKNEKEKDWIHMSPMKDDSFLFQYDRLTKSGSFWFRLFEMHEPHLTTKNYGETKDFVSSYLTMPRYDFECKYI